MASMKHLASRIAKKKSRSHYYTVIIPYVTVGQTEWHPTSPGFAPISRGAFVTAKKAHDWAREHLGAHARYGVKPIRRPEDVERKWLAALPSGVRSQYSHR